MQVCSYAIHRFTKLYSCFAYWGVNNTCCSAYWGLNPSMHAIHRFTKLYSLAYWGVNNTCCLAYWGIEYVRMYTGVSGVQLLTKQIHTSTQGRRCYGLGTVFLCLFRARCRQTSLQQPVQPADGRGSIHKNESIEHLGSSAQTVSGIDSTVIFQHR